MKFLAITDLHGNTEVLSKMDEQFKKADAVLFAGDFTKFNEPETGLPAMEAMCKKHDAIFAVLGNCDEESLMEEMENRDICVQKTLAMQEGIAITGCGGGTVFQNNTPYERTEEELLKDYNIITEEGEQEWNNLIAIMHNPPKNTECDKVAPEVHVGSEALRNFIETYKPLAVVTGHIHESKGICKIGNTTVVNPGPLYEGNYAWLEVKKSQGTWEVTQVTLETL